MRVKIWSTMPMRADCAGTKEPTCANNTIKAVWRMNVDLPPILGPVSNINLCLPSKRASLAMNCATCAATTGCLPWCISTQGKFTNSGCTHCSCAAIFAKAANTSKLAAALAMRCNTGNAACNSRNKPSNSCFSKAKAWSCALITLSSNTFNSGVM